MATPRDLTLVLRRLLGRRPPASVVVVAPGSAFEAVLDQRVVSLEQRLEELRGRINGLFFLILGTVLVQVVLRVAGF